MTRAEIEGLCERLEDQAGVLGFKAATALRAMLAREEVMRDELARILKCDAESTTKYGGLADCTDNAGGVYQSQELANCLFRARHLAQGDGE